MIFNQSRHAELVSASIPHPAWINWREAKPNRQIMPVRVSSFDQIDLPLPVPAFELLFASDGVGHIAEHFKADKTVDTVSTGETFDRAIPVLPQARDEVAGHADIEGSVGFAGEDIDAGVPLKLHRPESADAWTLKQVQGDAITEVSSPYRHIRHAEFISASIVRFRAEQCNA